MDWIYENEEHRTKEQSIAGIANKELESIAPTPCIADLAKSIQI